MKQFQTNEALGTGITKISVLRAMGLRIDDPLPDELTPIQFVQLQAGHDETEAREWMDCLERSIQNGKLVVRVETITEKKKEVIARYQLTSMQGRTVQQYKTKEQEVTIECRWLTRGAVSDWLLILEAEPSCLLKFWLEYTAKLSMPSQKPPLVASKGVWLSELQSHIQQHGRRHGVQKMVAMKIANREGLKWETVRRYITTAKKEAAPKYGAEKKQSTTWFPK